jgi:hypothetical protein
MGLDAQLVAIGPFTPRLIPFLEYPSDFYASVPEGATIIECFYTCLTSDESHRLAAAFGVGALELHRHVLDSGAADLTTLATLWEPQTVEAFYQLRESGFQFYYLPNA